MRQELLSVTVAAALAIVPAAPWAQQAKKEAMKAPTAAALATETRAGMPRLSDGVVKIGVLTDLSGAYSGNAGPGSVLAVKMAIEDFQAMEKGRSFPIELISADHQNKGDIASIRAREWFDRDQVDMINDLVTTSTALAVMPLAKEKNRITIVNGAASTPITGEQCTSTNVHYTYDTYALAHGTGQAVVRQGGTTWFFITSDYAFGHSLEKETTKVIEANGGKVLSGVRHPFPSSDFSSFLLKAKASGARVIGLANAGTDTTSTIKQAAEFGIMPGQVLAALLLFINDVHSLGLKVAQVMYLTTGFYWELNAQTRAWSKRFFERFKNMPTMIHAGDYSSTMHYLKAVKAAGTDEAQAVMKKMKETPINDFFAQGGIIRADGRMVHDMYLVQVKKPEESKAEWDYYHVREVIPAAQAFMPLSQSECPLVTK